MRFQIVLLREAFFFVLFLVLLPIKSFSSTVRSLLFSLCLLRGRLSLWKFGNWYINFTIFMNEFQTISVLFDALNKVVN